MLWYNYGVGDAKGNIPANDTWYNFYQLKAAVLCQFGKFIYFLLNYTWKRESMKMHYFPYKNVLQ